MAGLLKKLKNEFLPPISEHPLAEDLQWERHNLFMAEVGSRMVGSVIVACIVGLMFYSSATANALLTWFSGILFVAINSWVLIRWHYRSDHENRSLSYVRTWHWVNLYLSVIWGIFWALTPFLFFPDASQIQILSLLLLVVVASSMPSVTMGCYPDIYITFLTPVFFSFSWHLLSVDFGGEILPLIIAPLTWMMLVLFSIVIHRTHMESIILRLEHRNAQELADERTAAKTRFIAVASHDLRQPVQAARLYAEAMLSNPDMRNQETSEKLVRSLSSASHLLDRLLDISKLDAGVLEVNRQTVRVQKVLNEISAVHSVHAIEKGIQLRVQGEQCIVSADKSILIEILDNVIGNAVRYTDHGEVTVSAHASGGTVCLTVKDTGQGIPKAKQAIVFEEFVQLDSGPETVTGNAGMGLGLPIVKRLCELHAIPFEFESDVGVGTSFRFYLPRASDDSANSTEDSTIKDQSQLRILVIDDEPQITDSLSMILVAAGHDVEVANNMQQLKQILITGRFIPQLVLSDDRLPGNLTSGDMIEEVNSHLGRPIPAIIMTGNTSPERIQALRSSGYPILFKPVSNTEIMSAITQLDIS